MHRFFVPPPQGNDSTLKLTGREAHHGLHVLRLRPGESAVALDGQGYEYLCEIQAVDRQNITLGVRQKNYCPPLPYQITLLQAVPKGKIFEAIIQKATELGVARIVPLLSERVIPQLEDGKCESKLDKWRGVAIEAIKQCGAPWLPEIEAPLTPKEFLANGERFELPLIASLQNDRRHPRELMQRFQAEHKRLPRTVGVWVGPEGDFTPAELSAAKSAGALPISLGRLVLRCETAAIYCLAVLNYELQAAER
jgi:16S rRNA (uracil1498-N3)-methyltransferase